MQCLRTHGKQAWFRGWNAVSSSGQVDAICDLRSLFSLQKSSVSIMNDVESVQGERHTTPLPSTQQGSLSTRTRGSRFLHECVDTDPTKEVLDRALTHVQSYGWSRAALERGARDLDLSPALLGSLDHGPADLVRHFNRKCNDYLHEKLNRNKREELDTDMHGLLLFGLKTRLSMLIPYIDNWSEAMALLSKPETLPYALENGTSIADIVWAFAGDASADLTWYTKRAILMGIYGSAEMYMLTDSSEGCAETFKFVERNLHMFLQC